MQFNKHIQLKTSDDVYKLIKIFFDQYQTQHLKLTKISNQKARKALNQIKLLIPIYKDKSLSQNKK